MPTQILDPNTGLPINNPISGLGNNLAQGPSFSPNRNVNPYDPAGVGDLRNDPTSGDISGSLLRPAQPLSNPNEPWTVQPEQPMTGPPATVPLAPTDPTSKVYQSGNLTQPTASVLPSSVYQDTMTRATDIRAQIDDGTLIPNEDIFNFMVQNPAYFQGYSYNKYGPSYDSDAGAERPGGFNIRKIIAQGDGESITDSSFYDLPTHRTLGVKEEDWYGNEVPEGWDSAAYIKNNPHLNFVYDETGSKYWKDSPLTHYLRGGGKDQNLDFRDYSKDETLTPEQKTAYEKFTEPVNIVGGEAGSKIYYDDKGNTYDLTNWTDEGDNLGFGQIQTSRKVDGKEEKFPYTPAAYAALNWFRQGRERPGSPGGSPFLNQFLFNNPWDLTRREGLPGFLKAFGDPGHAVASGIGAAAEDTVKGGSEGLGFIGDVLSPILGAIYGPAGAALPKQIAGSVREGGQQYKGKDSTDPWGNIWKPTLSYALATGLQAGGDYIAGTDGIVGTDVGADVDVGGGPYDPLTAPSPVPGPGINPDTGLPYDLGYDTSAFDFDIGGDTYDPLTAPKPINQPGINPDTGLPYDLGYNPNDYMPDINPDTGLQHDIGFDTSGEGPGGMTDSTGKVWGSPDELSAGVEFPPGEGGMTDAYGKVWGSPEEMFAGKEWGGFTLWDYLSQGLSGIGAYAKYIPLIMSLLNASGLLGGKGGTTGTPTYPPVKGGTSPIDPTTLAGMLAGLSGGGGKTEQGPGASVGGDGTGAKGLEAYLAQLKNDRMKGTPGYYFATGPQPNIGKG